MSRGVEVRPRRPALGHVRCGAPPSTRRRATGTDRRRSAVADPAARDVVTTAADRELDLVLAREADTVGTSAGSLGRAMSSGRLSIIPFQTLRASG